MSLGTSSLGNLLVQRLDSALGVSQTAQNRTGAHPDALRQSPPSQRLAQTEQQNRSTRETADKTKQSRAGATAQGRHDPRVAAQLQRYTDSRFTASAPTTLGRTAQTLLALLAQHQNQPVQGERPLLPARPVLTSQPSVTGQTPSTQTQHLRVQPQDAQTGSRVSAQVANQSSATSLSNTTSGTGTGATPSSGPAAPLATAATPATNAVGALVQLFAQALGQNVQQSGMFYESHLAQLMKGQMTAAQLQRQPQAQAHHQNATPTTKNTNPANTTSAATTLAQSGIEPSTQPTVRQQLEVLANQVFTWRGEAWQGVPMEWELRRHPEHEEETPTSSPTAHDDPPWQTRLRLDLPHLGQVEANLHIQDKTVRLSIQAPESANHLKQNVTQFVDRLEAQGIAIQQLQIVRHPYADGLDDYEP